jgi:predicted DNA-binding protein with PD1-like motif
MKSRLIKDGPQRTYALVFDSGDDFLETLQQFARANKLGASQFTGIGGFSRVVLGFFELGPKTYKRIPVEEQVEVVSLMGDIALADGEATLHPHVVVAKPDGSAHGGHLLEAAVRPTLEVIVTESPAHLRRKPDPQTGLALIEL